jgi:lysophospholipase L1-like esterase
MKRITLAVLVLAAALSWSPGADAAPDPRPGTVLVLGDSITQQYTDDPGDPQQGWWSILAAQRNLTPITSAQGGGAIIKKGFGCIGTSIRERYIGAIRRTRPDEIWIASGKNETTVCINGSIVPVASAFRTQALATFFASLGELADEMGIPRDRVYVTTPWGTNNLDLRHDVVVDMAEGARAAGLTFINTPRLGDDKTRDGTHPNLAGSQYIAAGLLAGMS